MPKPYREETQDPLKIPEKQLPRVSIKQRDIGKGGAIWRLRGWGQVEAYKVEWLLNLVERALAEGFLEWVPEQCGTQKTLTLIYTLGEVQDTPRSLKEGVGRSDFILSSSP